MSDYEHLPDCKYQFAPLDVCGCEVRQLKAKVEIDAITMANFLARIDTLQAEVERLQNPWISVDERLPKDEHQEVEVCFWDGVMMCRDFGGYTPHGWYTGDEPIEEYPFKVTHWREPTPLPPPLKEQSDE